MVKSLAEVVDNILACVDLVTLRSSIRKLSSLPMYTMSYLLELDSTFLLLLNILPGNLNDQQLYPAYS